MILGYVLKSETMSLIFIMRSNSKHQDRKSSTTASCIHNQSHSSHHRKTLMMRNTFSGNYFPAMLMTVNKHDCTAEMHYISGGIIFIFTALHLSDRYSYQLPCRLRFFTYKTYNQLIKYDASVMCYRQYPTIYKWLRLAPPRVTTTVKRCIIIIQ